jgi:hypothetical protein
MMSGRTIIIIYSEALDFEALDFEALDFEALGDKYHLSCCPARSLLPQNYTF